MWRYCNLRSSMWHKAEWMGHPMRVELTRVDLLVKVANHYTTKGALCGDIVLSERDNELFIFIRHTIGYDSFPLFDGFSFRFYSLMSSRRMTVDKNWLMYIRVFWILAWENRAVTDSRNRKLAIKVSVFEL